MEFPKRIEAISVNSIYYETFFIHRNINSDYFALIYDQTADQFYSEPLKAIKDYTGFVSIN